MRSKGIVQVGLDVQTQAKAAAAIERRMARTRPQYKAAASVSRRVPVPSGPPPKAGGSEAKAKVLKSILNSWISQT